VLLGGPSGGRGRKPRLKLKLLRPRKKGASRAKPVGTVCFAWALPSDNGPTLGAETAWIKVETCHFEGDRAAVRLATHAHALERLLALLNHRG